MPSMVSPQDQDDCLITLYFGRGKNYLRLCLDRAYGDFKRTLRGIGDHEGADQARNSADAALIEMFKAIQATNAPTQQQFDDWHSGACRQLTHWVRRRFTIAPLDVEFLLWMGRQLPSGVARDAVSA